jgi:hypothetical protein
LRQSYQKQINAIDADQAAVSAFAARAGGFFRDVAKRSHVQRWAKPAKQRRDRLGSITIGSIMICIIAGSATGRAGAVHGLDH